ncbi:hypothetical protein Nepgr_014140 [Nepenthes gracilis]|uniref:Uncharacterized protein n=1 Tax=Nepenthes gracilis TaxID=150966 RepID=A0AAD3XPV3_NEPGR|nr:hypothetical protein Nepgr_014140 [Nepenthes gracilis]
MSLTWSMVSLDSWKEKLTGPINIVNPADESHGGGESKKYEYRHEARTQDPGVTVIQPQRKPQGASAGDWKIWVGGNLIHGRFSSGESGIETGHSLSDSSLLAPSSPSSLLASLKRMRKTRHSSRGTKGTKLDGYWPPFILWS